jgi:2-polyprenyl-6-hydroxyphenyl methylase/3-demethylubiquinone-9 3-methyltransferase
MSIESNTTVDQTEVDRFSAMADEWWDPTGKFKPLHKFNPARLTYIRDQAAVHFGRDFNAPFPLKGLSVLDIGCGGGLISEPVSRMGGIVLGADASATNIEVARLHASQTGLEIDYRATTAEALAEEGNRFDIVLNLEVVEHVADRELFLNACASMVKPGGLMFIATINRTLKALAFAIVGAEYVLKWLPRGTHSYEKLVRPEEIAEPLGRAGMTVIGRTGVAYNPLKDGWDLARDMDVNYMLLAGRPGSRDPSGNP